MHKCSIFIILITNCMHIIIITPLTKVIDLGEKTGVLLDNLCWQPLLNTILYVDQMVDYGCIYILAVDMFIVIAVLQC